LKITLWQHLSPMPQPLRRGLVMFVSVILKRDYLLTGECITERAILLPSLGVAALPDLAAA